MDSTSGRLNNERKAQPMRHAPSHRFGNGMDSPNAWPIERNATVAGEPITSWAPKSTGAEAYRALAREVIDRFGT